MILSYGRIRKKRAISPVIKRGILPLLEESLFLWIEFLIVLLNRSLFTVLVICHLYVLSQMLCAFLQLLHQIHSYTQIEWKAGILMCHIHCLSDKQMQLRTLFDDQLCQSGGSVFRIQFIKKCLIKFIVLIPLQKS